MKVTYIMLYCRKNMSRNNAKSLTTVRQKYRKYAKDFEEDLKVFRENPDAPDSEGEAEREDAEDDSDVDDHAMDAPSFKKDTISTK